MDGQGTKRRRKIAKNFNRLSRVDERYRQTDDRQTDGTATTYSEREREFTFAKNHSQWFLCQPVHLFHMVVQHDDLLLSPNCFASIQAVYLRSSDCTQNSC